MVGTGRQCVHIKALKKDYVLSDNHGGTACYFMLTTTKESCSQNDNQRFLITDNFCNS